MPLADISAEQLRSLIAETAAVTWSAGPEGVVLSAPQWFDLTGQPEEEMRALGWLEVVHPDDRERAAAAWTTARDHGQPLNTLFRIRCQDGIYRWFNSRGAPIRSSEGMILRWVGVCLEIPSMALIGASSPESYSGLTEVVIPLDARAIRSARGALNWSAAELSEHSGVSQSTIRRFESENSDVQTRQSSTMKLVSAFRKAGVAFLVEENGVFGLRFDDRDKLKP